MPFSTTSVPVGPSAGRTPAIPGLVNSTVSLGSLGLSARGLLLVHGGRNPFFCESSSHGTGDSGVPFSFAWLPSY